MKRIYTIFFLLMLALTTVSAQKAFTVRGELRDSLSDEAIPFATVRATLHGTTRPASLTTSDEKGQFALSIPKAGTYRVDITYIGMKPLSRNLTLTAASRKIEWGVLRMLNTNTLSEAKVQVQRNVVKADIDKITYSMEDDPDSETNPLLEMLRKVPMVTVDGEDNIQVNGSSSFKVYVNGKPNNMMTSNPSDILKNYPASSVKKVEVITDPGARFDAEGVAGILNIITHSGVKTKGYNFSPRLNVEHSSIRGGAFLMAQLGKFTVSANYGFGYHHDPKGTTGSEREVYGTTDALGNTTLGTLLTSEGESQRKGFFNFGSLEASYEATKRDLFSINAGVHGHNGSPWSSATFNMVDELATPLYSYTRTSDARSKRMNFDFGFDYQHTFGPMPEEDTQKEQQSDVPGAPGQGKPGMGKGGPGGGRGAGGHGGPGGPGAGAEGPGRGSVDAPTLTVSYRFSHAPSYERSYNRYTDVLDPASLLASLDGGTGLIDLYSYPTRTSQEHSAQVDFSTPFLSHHNISVGGKYTRRNNHSDDQEFHSPFGAENWTLSNANSLEYLHLNDIAAAYAEYTYKLKSFTARGGVRYEYSHVDVDYPSGNAGGRTPFKATFSDFVPSLSLGYNIKMGQMLKLIYNMRLGRPNITQLSPYRDHSQPQTVSYGNAELETENAHNMNLNYTYFNMKFNLSTTLGYNIVNNGITPFTFIPAIGGEEGQAEINSTFANVLHSRTLNLNIFANWTIVQGTQLNINFNGDYRRLNTDYQQSEYTKNLHLTDDSNSGFGMFVFAGLRQDLPWKLKLGINAGCGLPRIELQGKGSTFYFYGIRLSRSFLEGDRLTISLRANNFIDPTFRWENTVQTSSYRSFSWTKSNRMRLGVGISFRLGKLKVEDMQRARRAMQEDMEGANYNME